MQMIFFVCASHAIGVDIWKCVSVIVLVVRRTHLPGKGAVEVACFV